MNTYAFYMINYAPLQMLTTFTNSTIFDVRRDLVPLPKLRHILCSHLISSLDNLMMTYIQGRNMYLYIIYCY